jgi:hypothetical protein
MVSFDQPRIRYGTTPRTSVPSSSAWFAGGSARWLHPSRSQARQPGLIMGLYPGLELARTIPELVEPGGIPEACQIAMSRRWASVNAEGRPSGRSCIKIGWVETSPQCHVSFGTNGDWHSEVGPLVVSVTGDYRFGPLIGQIPIVETSSDDGRVSVQVQVRPLRVDQGVYPRM